MAGWLTLMLIVAVAGREATRELNVFQIMAVRSVLGFFMLYPLIHMNGGLAAMKTSRPLQHIARNLIHYAAQLGWFFALTLIPLGQVVSIEFTMPIWTAILAASFLGERITIAKVLAIVLGLLGVAIIVRPGTSEINPGQLIALGAAVGFGVSIAMVKSLTRTEPTLRILFWMIVVQGAAGFFPALYAWQWPSAYTWGWLVVIAFCGTFSHYCMARAMLYADATVVIPMDFLRVPLTALANLLRATGHVHHARRSAHPDRKPAQLEKCRAPARTRWNLTALADASFQVRCSILVFQKSSPGSDTIVKPAS
jgi:drug/metabolite transporter (DMT)-like permease